MMTRRFFLDGLECACRIGAYDHERHGPQRVIIDAEIRLDGDTEPRSDSLDEALNYDLIRESILAGRMNKLLKIAKRESNESSGVGTPPSEPADESERASPSVIAEENV